MKKKAETETDKIRALYFYLINETEESISIKFPYKNNLGIDSNNYFLDLKLLKKMAENLSEKEFIIAYQTKLIPAVKLTSQEQERLKGGLFGGADLLSFID